MTTQEDFELEMVDEPRLGRELLKPRVQIAIERQHDLEPCLLPVSCRVVEHLVGHDPVRSLGERRDHADAHVG